MRIGKNRIAITGLGIISCLGLDRNTVQLSLQDQGCGIKLLKSRKNLGSQSGLSGVIKGFDDRSVLNRYSGRKLKDIGKCFGIGESAVSQNSLRFNPILLKDKKLRKRIDKINRAVGLSDV